MLRSLNIRSRNGIHMTGKASLQNLLLRHHGESPNRGLFAHPRDVLATRPVATFAAGLLGRFVARETSGWQPLQTVLPTKGLFAAAGVAVCPARTGHNHSATQNPQKVFSIAHRKSTMLSLVSRKANVKVV